MSAQKILDDYGMDLLFREARTYAAWKEAKVSDATLHALYDLMKFGPTSANCCPVRLFFIQSEGAKEKLKPHLDKGNVDKTMKAPVTAIIAHDLEFYEHLPKLYPPVNAKSWFAGNEQKIQDTAFRNGALQGAYFIMAARSLGLDCGPMSGFDAGGVKQAFFADEPYEVNFLCNIGYGDPEALHPRLPRFAFSEVCKVL